MSQDAITVESDGKDYKSCDAARTAFYNNDVEASRREHMKAMHAESHNSSASEYIKSVVFGGLDGIMTTLAIIAAAAGSNGDWRTILVFGISNLIADAFAMGFGEYVSGKAELENAMSERRREEWEVENSFDLEVDEMIQIYMAKGISYEDAKTIVMIISKDPKLFVDIMMVEELGLLVDIEDTSGPLKQGLMMFTSFMIFGAIPLLAYAFGRGQGIDIVLFISCVLTAASLIGLGAVKGYLIHQSMFESSALMLINGAISGIVSFVAGYLIEAALAAEVAM